VREVCEAYDRLVSSRPHLTSLNSDHPILVSLYHNLAVSATTRLMCSPLKDADNPEGSEKYYLLHSARLIRASASHFSLDDNKEQN
jgi:hypothetical protein